MLKEGLWDKPLKVKVVVLLMYEVQARKLFEHVKKAYRTNRSYQKITSMLGGQIRKKKIRTSKAGFVIVR